MRERRKCRKDSVSLQNAEVAKIIGESQDGELTLQQVGDLFEITRMRVCQIEKASLKKLASLEALKGFT